MKFGLKAWLLASLVGLFFAVLRRTWRIEEDEVPVELQQRKQSGQPLVYAHWHEDEWALLGAFAGRKMTVLVSHSDDGSAMARFLRGLGFQVLRGSSSRGGARGFLQMIRSVREQDQAQVSLAVDGPRGPRRQAKKGIVKLADAFKAPLICGAAHADRAWVFKKSWNKAFVPKPFARIRVCYEILPLTEKSEEVEARCLKVESSLLKCKERAELAYKAHSTA